MSRLQTMLGDAEMRSPLFSNEWTLVSHETVLAKMRRHPDTHTSTITTTDGMFELVPEGWGTVVAYLDGQERGRIERRSWWGRTWELSSNEFAFILTSDPLPRRWSLRVGNEAVGRLAGGVVSYNRLRIHADLSVPIVAVGLAWHVLARPWEAASAPRSLVPVRQAPAS